jgi:tetratricopeptide (TPR) repeat protein
LEEEMARISLREYNHEIESLIDRGDTQKAIAHCKQILRTYPKHIDTYRLFGKALLELQKYGDASDIFTRVLSSIPDDFISQIGMSIIREDENNLDAAIWHLERAFEIQPSNKAVQDELKRLYSKRDGVTPTKIRLTRGALVRMYTRGELYPQAVAEIKAAIQEDQNRIDLEVILARLYFILGQKVEATETCSSLIAKLPFCYEANRILAALLPGTSRDEDAKIFKQRVIDLDPYFAFVSDNTPNPIDIPDNKVMVEYQEWDPGIETQQQPDWAKSIGINWSTDESSETSQIQSWLHSESELKASTENQEATLPADGLAADFSSTPPNLVIEAKEILPQQPEDRHEDQLLPENTAGIPNWMAEAGWSPSNDVDLEAQKGFNLDLQNETPIESEPVEEIQPGSIPDWIQKLAPKDIPSNEEAEIEGGLPIDDKSFDSLFMTPPAETKKIEPVDFTIPSADWTKEFPTFEDQPEAEIVGDLIEEKADSDGYEDMRISFEEEEFVEEQPEEFVEEQQAEFSEEQQNEIVKAFENLQENLENQNLPVIETPAVELQIDQPEDQPEMEVADFTASELPADEVFQENVVEELSSEAAIAEQPMEEHAMDAEQPMEQPASAVEIPQEEPSSEMKWLHDLIHEGDGLETSITDEIATSELPDLSSFIQSDTEPRGENLDGDFAWLNALQSDFNSEKTAESKESVGIAQPEDLEAQSAIQDAEPATEEKQIIEEPAELDVTSISLEEKTPDWIESLISEIPYQPEEISTPKTMPLEANLEEAISPSIEGENEAGEESELDAALAWMEGLAARHGATEETLTSPPEERKDTPPDWVKALQDVADQEKKAVTNKTISDASQLFGDSDLTPSWLQELQLETFEEGLTNNALPQDFNEENGSEMEVEAEEAAISESQTAAETEEVQFETAPALEGLPVADVSEEPGEVIPLPTEIEQTAMEPIQELEDSAEAQVDMVEEPVGAIPALEETALETAEPEGVEEDRTVIGRAVTGQFELGKLALQKGNVDEALSMFNRLIKSRDSLDEIIGEIKNALSYDFPISIELWQTLGDAYLRKNQLKDALHAYSKAEELLS